MSEIVDAYVTRLQPKVRGIIKGTAKSPADRFPNADSMITELTHAASGDDTTLVIRPRPVKAKSGTPFFNPSALDLLLVGLAVAAVAGFVAMGLSFGWF